MRDTRRCQAGLLPPTPGLPSSEAGRAAGRAVSRSGRETGAGPLRAPPPAGPSRAAGEDRGPLRALPPPGARLVVESPPPPPQLPGDRTPAPPQEERPPRSPFPCAAGRRTVLHRTLLPCHSYSRTQGTSGRSGPGLGQGRHLVGPHVSSSGASGIGSGSPPLSTRFLRLQRPACRRPLMWWHLSGPGPATPARAEPGPSPVSSLHGVSPEPRPSGCLWGEEQRKGR